jgi:hypothetical protein
VPSQFQFDVFLSHSAKDKVLVRELAARLQQDGMRVWLDEGQVKPGDNIPAKIEDGLEHSRVLVLCMSANAFGSDWAQLEAGTFRFRDPLNRERRFVPLRLDDAPLKGSLAQFLYINWLPANRNQEYAKLLEACRDPITWPLSAQDLKVEGEQTVQNEQSSYKSGWVFQDLPDHQIRAYHRQLCDQYADLNSFDLLELCGKWRQLAMEFTREACASGRHGAHVLHDSSVDSVTRLLETSCAVRGLHGIDRLSRCLRRPDDGHLHNALALLDDLEARFRAEAIAKHAPSTGSQQLEKKSHSQTDPVQSNKQVRIVHSGSGDIVMGNKTVGRSRVNFTPGPQHITPETSRKLYELVKEIVERITVSGGNVQKAFQRVWGDFNGHFGLTTYKELPREKAEEGISYLRQWRASKNSKLRFADPEKFRTAQLKGIWPRSKGLGLTDENLYYFATKKLKLKSLIGSLNELGNQQLARLNRFLIYEERKRKKPSKHTAIEADQ